MNQLAAGVAYMHSRGIIHRDIKTSNILLHGQQLRIGDFGLAIFEPGSNFCGTAGYTAPEVLLQRQYSTPVDIFSLGVVWYQLIYCAHPFDSGHRSEDLCANRILSLLHNPIKLPSAHMTHSHSSLLLKTLNYYPDHRVTAAELVKALKPLETAM
jgi:serine/threonine protein kinase